MNTTLALVSLLALGAPFGLDTPAKKELPKGTPVPVLYTVAVLDFKCSLEGYEELGPQVSTALSAYLSREEALLTVERSDLLELLSEHELSLSGLVQPSSAAVVGQISGAKVLITGRVFVSGDEYFLVTKIIGTETSRVLGEVMKISVDESPVDLTEALAAKVAQLIRERGDQLLAKKETHEAFLERLRKQVQGKVLPTLSVNIAENHVGRPVLDPAAETEVTRLLTELGFTVLDPAITREKAKIAIFGEALSEFATRRGNLISCQGRVELKALQTNTGVVLTADRQTEMAVDLGEHMAAKAALQRSAKKLVERLVAKIVPQ